MSLKYHTHIITNTMSRSRVPHVKAQTIEKFEFDNGGLHLVQNREKRPMVCPDPKIPALRAATEYSYIHSVGKHLVTKFVTLEQTQKWLDELTKYDTVVVMHHTLFCKNCKRPSSYFIDDERRGHSTCRGCGVVQRLCQNKFSLHLTDDGEANKSQWNHTPGMTARDCAITSRKGRKFGRKPASHLRNYWRIRNKVEEVANDFNFCAVESLIRKAKGKLRKFYYDIHDEDEEPDMSFKLPHGGAALAAACFYCAVLEFEDRVGHKTICTLPAIQQSAQACRDKKNGRKCRDVTDSKILRYSKRLRRHNLCSVSIPTIGAETLQFHPKSASLQHARMAIFSECQPVRFNLPAGQRWGIRVVDTNQGVIKIESCQPDKIAWQLGLRKGDYLFQLNRDTVDVFCTAKKLEAMISDIKKKDHPVIQIAIMRKKKNKL